MNESYLIQKNFYLSFLIGKETYAIDISNVLEVIEIEKITKVPNAPENIDGVINFRGNIIPVYDLGYRLNNSDHQKNALDVLIILQIPYNKNIIKIAIISEKVYEVFGAFEKDIKPITDLSGRYDTSLLEGKVKYHNDFILLIDIEQIVVSPQVVQKPG
ncbi:MAG: chemotaxis protein CheW [Bacteroidales bacterium]|nr:chemotaxis protein CheW [Bacteroidales bacterium]